MDNILADVKRKRGSQYIYAYPDIGKMEFAMITNRAPDS